MAGNKTSLIKRSAALWGMSLPAWMAFVQIFDQPVFLARQDALADTFVHRQCLQRGVLVDLFIFFYVKEVAGVIGQRLRMAVEEQVFR